jgi:hypothetical protein
MNSNVGFICRTAGRKKERVRENIWYAVMGYGLVNGFIDHL